MQLVYLSFLPPFGSDQRTIAAALFSYYDRPLTLAEAYRYMIDMN
jgi:hypothetical protein